MIISLRPRQFSEKLAATPDAVLVDVRRPEEFQTGHIHGSINLNFEDESYRDKVSKLDKDKSYFLCCRAGNRSLLFGEYLIHQGFNRIYNLEAGLFSWVNYGNPVVEPYCE